MAIIRSDTTTRHTIILSRRQKTKYNRRRVVSSNNNGFIIISRHFLFSLSAMLLLLVFILRVDDDDDELLLSFGGFIPMAMAATTTTNNNNYYSLLPPSSKQQWHSSSSSSSSGWDYQIRGGGGGGSDIDTMKESSSSSSSSQEEKKKTKEQSVEQRETSQEANDDDGDAEPKKKIKEKIRKPLSAAFRMNEAVKDQASSVAENTSLSDDDDDEPVEDENNDPQSSRARGVLVGGAMVKTKSPISSELDTNRVSPMSSRLLNDTEDLEENPTEANDDEHAEPKTKPKEKIRKPLSAAFRMNEAVKDQASSVAENISLSDDDDDDEPAEDENNDPQITNQTSDSTSDSDLQLADSSAKDENEREQEGGDEEGESASFKIIEDATNVTTKVQQETEAEGEGEGELMTEAEVEQAETETNPSVETVQSSGDPFLSSGLWVPIDNLITFGLASNYPSLKLSRKLRTARKMTARLTGLHGFVSGKPSPAAKSDILETSEAEGSISDIQKRVAAIEKARQGVEQAVEADVRSSEWRRIFGRRRQKKDETEGGGKMAIADSQNEKTSVDDSIMQEKLAEEAKRLAEEEKRKIEEAMEDRRRMERVKQIDSLISEGQERLQQLICEKDVLQRRPNPLFNYATEEVEAEDPTKDNQESAALNSTLSIQASRKFNFPPDDLVEEYLDMIISTRRLIKMNHTYLWKDKESMYDDEDDTIGDDLFTPSVDAHKLYQDADTLHLNGKKGRQKNNNVNTGNGKNGKSKNGGGGSWLLRQSFGKGPSLGEKIGEAAEQAAYKAVCAAVMSFLARALSSLHGINVMQHSDIRLVPELAPDLPPVGEGVIPGSSNNYAQEAIKTVMRSKAQKSKKRSKFRPSEDSFVQRDAVTEMLLSHVQISAPLLKLFPLAWQRAFLGNIITLCTALMSDFFDGLQFQILGHRLSFSFKPITEEDMIHHFALAGGGFNHRRAKPEEFEAAVRATARDVGEELKFLDRWHERALGSGVLRDQIANLIARIVLTLTDEVLSGARIDLWSAQAGGPRMVVGLEYRTKANS